MVYTRFYFSVLFIFLFALVTYATARGLGRSQRCQGRSKEDAVFPHDKDCTRYYECDKEGFLFEKRCPQYTTFNRYELNCAHTDTIPCETE